MSKTTHKPVLTHCEPYNNPNWVFQTMCGIQASYGSHDKRRITCKRCLASMKARKKP